VGADADSGKENDESRAPIDAAAAAPAARALRERTVAVIGAAATLGTSRPGVMNAESIETPERPVTLLPRRPVVVIVEDTESFDNRVLSDLLLALSDAGDTLPVCVLLGVATSASMMHGIIPAAVAARLRVESFSLWSPKAIMTAVQENVLLDPGFVPAPSNAALELLVTRFAEHDFSLSAARRAMHLLALDHFMTRELSSLAMCMTAAMNAAAEATDALAADDVDAADVDAADVDASIARIARLATKKKAIANAASEKALEKAKAVADETLTPSSVAWAKKHLTDFQTGECWVHSNANDAVAADSIARTVADGYAGRRRWAVALRCVAAAATTARYARDEAKLSTLLVDASSTRWLEFFPETLPPGAHVDASDKAQGGC
jgi:origin recognition complex subunit 3